MWVRELFFDRFVPKKDEALAIKEGSPLEYMPLIAEEFWRATGFHLYGLLEFTLWLPWAIGRAGPNPGVPPFDGGTFTQVAPTKAQRVLPGLVSMS